ncbi:MAG: hypothetical protein ABW167_13195 [Baekduia sp.]
MSAVQYTSKPGDSAVAALNSFEEFVTILPQGSVVEKTRVLIGDGHDATEYLVLRVRGREYDAADGSGKRTDPVSLTLHCFGFPEERNVYPHTNLDVRRIDAEARTNMPIHVRKGTEIEIADTVALTSTPTSDIDRLNEAERLLTNLDVPTSDVEQAINAARSAIDSARGKLLAETEKVGKIGPVGEGEEYPTISSGG